MTILLDRTVLCLIAIAFSVGLVSASKAQAAVPRALPPDQLPSDHRLGPLASLDKGDFTFSPPSTVGEWTKRAERVRRQVLVASGLWPMPTKTSANAAVYGRVEREDYTVDRVQLESFPGHFITGNLYRPKGNGSKRPAVLCPHGHWADGRFFDRGEEKIRRALVEGRERFEVGGRFPLQARCVQLARMGCVVFHYDMVGYADSIQLTHRPGLRESMNTSTDWGFFSPQAELRLQNMMGVQTYNSVCALDWICSLPEVDPHRIGVTGASGGGTQTFILCAIDSRPKVALPAVIVSASMQGGCSCENAPYLRIGTGNVELAALMAPRPLALTAADDWTKEIATVGFPELKALYELLGAESQVTAQAFVHFPHNYNNVSRAVMYHWFNKHLDLGLDEPIVENDFQPLSIDEMTVWDVDHPMPGSGDEYERSLLRWMTNDSGEQIASLVPTDQTTMDKYRETVGGAWDVLIGRGVPPPKSVIASEQAEVDQDGWTQTTFLLRSESQKEELPAIMLQPKQWNNRIVVWIDKEGKQSLFALDGMPRGEIRELLHSGTAVLGVDLVGQGEFTSDGRPLARQRIHSGGDEPWSRYAGFTFGYNHPLFSQRVHDILSAVAFARDMAQEQMQIDLVGLHGAGHWVAAARAQAGPIVDRAVIDTAGFRFVDHTEFDDVDFLPGSVKYLDIPGLLMLGAPGRTCLLGEESIPAMVQQAYEATGASNHVTLIDVELLRQDEHAVRWLLQ